MTHNNLSQIESLIAEELVAANEKFPAFSSTHEGWAVLLEEVEEVVADVKGMCADGDILWDWIKTNRPIQDLTGIVGERIKTSAIRAIKELIQVAAMCDKFDALGKEEVAK